MAKKKYFNGFRINIRFRDVYSNYYCVEVFSTCLLRSSSLNRIIHAQIDDLPKNRVVRSSISVEAVAVRMLNNVECV